MQRSLFVSLVLGFAVCTSFPLFGAPVDCADQTDLLAKLESLHTESRRQEIKDLSQSHLIHCEASITGDGDTGARFLSLYAQSLKELNEYAEAKNRYRQALALLPNFDESPVILSGRILSEIADIDRIVGDPKEAEDGFRKAIDVLRRVAPNGPDRVNALSKLGLLFRQLSRYTEAETYYQQAIDLARKNGLEQKLISSLSNYAIMLDDQGRYLEAESIHRDALSFYEDQYESSIAVERSATVQNNLGLNLSDQGKYRDAVIYLRSARKIDNKFNAKRRYGRSTNNLGITLWKMGRLVEAEERIRESLRIYEELFGTQHEYTATIMNTLGVVYREQGRIPQSLNLQLSALQVIEETVGVHTRRAYWLKGNLADTYAASGEHSKAEQLYLSAIQGYRQLFTNAHPQLGRILTKYAEFLDQIGRSEEAESYHNDALKILREQLGSQHPRVAESLMKAAHNAARRTEYQIAITRTNEARQILQRALGDDNIRVADVLLRLAEYQRATANTGEALASVRAATANYSNFLSTERLDDGLELYRYLDQFRPSFVLHAELIEVHDQRTDISAYKESLDISQLAQITRASIASRQNSARAVVGEGSELIRKYQELLREKEALLGRRLKLASIPGEGRNDEIKTIESSLSNLDLVLFRYAAQVERFLPEYRSFIVPRPMELSAIQSALPARKLVVSILVGPKQTLIWGITADDVHVHRFDIREEDLNLAIASIRQAMQTPWDTDAYPVEESFMLYQGLLQPVRQRFPNIDEIFIIPDQRTHAIPYPALITAEFDISKPFREIPWLVRDLPVTTLPTMHVIRPKPSASAITLGYENFIGFGYGMMGKQGGLASLAANRTRSGDILVNYDEVSNLETLPSTVEELRSISNMFGPGNARVFVENQSTEEQLKQSDLSKYDVIEFATHAIEVQINEKVQGAALVLAEVDRQNPEQDGLLTSREIEKLDLNSPLIILSACDTAATSDVGRQPYSGLASAFLFAGAKSVVATHWPVESVSSARIVTGMFRYLNDDNGRSIAEALRLSMLELADSTDEEIFNHPAFWAPFIVVGKEN